MKKIVLSLLVISSLYFSASAQCTPSCSSELTDCYEPLYPAYPPYPCGTGSCSGSIKVPNFQYSKTGSTVNISNFAVCWVPGGTPPWTSTNTAGRVKNTLTTLRPSVTRTFNMTAMSTGAIFQVVIQADGLCTIRMTSGTAPAVGFILTNGTYNL